MTLSSSRKITISDISLFGVQCVRNYGMVGYTQPPLGCTFTRNPHRFLKQSSNHMMYVTAVSLQVCPC